jgi:hypothetical protein
VVPAHGDADLDEHLGVADGGLVRALVEVGHVDDPVAAGAADHRGGAQRREDRVEVLGRVGLAQRAADGPAVAHRRVGDQLLGLADDREALGEQVGLEDVAMPRERADAHLRALVADVGQLALERVDVDEVLRRGQPQLHHRQQRVAPGDQPRLGAEPLQQRDGLVDARRARVLERRGYLHAAPSLLG